MPLAYGPQMLDSDGTPDVPPAPPRQDEYPPGALIAVVDDSATGEAALLAARASSASQPYLLTAVQVLALREARDDDQGPLRRVYLALGSLVSDQRTLEDRYVEEARLGHDMVVASAEDDDQADRVWAALKSAGAHTGLWLTGTTLRDMV